MHSVNPVIANLIGGYKELVGLFPGTAWLVLCPRIEFMLIMCPFTSRSFIDLIAWRVHKIFPTSSLSMIWRISFVLFSSVSRDFVKTPPLFTRRSTPPKVFSTQVKAVATDCSFAMSHSTALSCPLILSSPTRKASTLSFLNVKDQILLHDDTWKLNKKPFSKPTDNHSRNCQLLSHGCSNSLACASDDCYFSFPAFHSFFHDSNFTLWMI